MKKILFVLPFKPYPLSHGGAQAIYNGINVVKDSYQVYITYVKEEIQDDGNDLLKAFSNNVELYPFFIPIQKKNKKKTIKEKIINKVYILLKKILRYKEQNDTITLSSFDYKKKIDDDFFQIDSNYVQHINNIIEDKHIDIVQCEMLETVAISLMLPKKVKKVFVHHEIGWVVKELLIKERQFEQKFYLKYSKLIEVALLNNFDCVITLSSTDKEKLKSAGVNVPIKTSFAVVNTECERLLPINEYNILSFIGPEINPPNVQGIKWFVKDIWPYLKDKDKSYKLQIIGNWSQYGINEILDGVDDVHFLGYVDDLSKVLKNSIMIVPIKAGSGIRMKILESSILGIPCVTTTVGVEGIPFENGVHCMIADDPKEFAKSILLLKKQELREKIRTNANSLVKEYYSIDAFKKNRLDVYKML